MWLLPFLSRFSGYAVRAFYRFEVAGTPIAGSGPVLVVANHPNAIIDPGMVAAATGRNVRFLAKAPLFSHPAIGWIVRGSGAIPIYRKQDDPSLLEKNDDVLRDVQRALAAGATVGVFPEGISHNEPSMTPLRTGAARIALGAAELNGGSAAGIQIVPVGLTYRHKERFRSSALALISEPVSWEDLAPRGLDDFEASRELTLRIEKALRHVTINLERWEDRPAVECAEAIYSAEFDLPGDPELRLERVRQVARALSMLRSSSDEKVESLFSTVLRFQGIVEQLGVSVAALEIEPALAAAVRWTLLRLPLLIVGLPLYAAGTALFAVPYFLAGRVAGLRRVSPDVRATVKMFAGALFSTVWIVLLVIAAAVWLGARAAVVVGIGLPLLAVMALLAGDRLRKAFHTAGSYLRLGRRGTLRERLLARRKQIALELEQLRVELGERPRVSAKAG